MTITSSIRFRLSLLIGIVVMLSVGISAGYSSWVSFEREIENRARILEASSSVFAASVAEATAEQNVPTAYRQLSGVRNLPSLLHAEIILIDGRSLASFGSGATLVGRDRESRDMTLRDIWAAESLRVTVPIMSNGEKAGDLSILAGVADLKQTTLKAIRDMVLIALFAIAICLTIAQVFLAYLTRPLRQLATQMAQFGEDQASTFKPVSAGQDETGILADAFNEMVTSIQLRDTKLAYQMETLEETVNLRTKDLRLARDDAEAANAAKSDFLATMSHEIRTPMNGLLVMAEMLSSADLSQKHRRYAEIITRSGKGLLTIINDILDLSKIESGKLNLETVPVSLDALATDTLSLFWEKAREKQLELASYVSPQVPATVLTDPTRFNQVLTNLVNNALKFTSTGGVFVSVSAKPTSSPERVTVICEVSDTGIGIPQDKLDTIFDAFSQADQTTTRRFGGTGLGLAVCKRLSHAMDGDISVSSQEGAGSCFRFEFDVDVEEPAQVLPVARPLSVELRCGDGFYEEALRRSMNAYGVSIVETGADFIIAQSVGVDADFPPDAPIIVMSEIGDARCDTLIREGIALDLLPQPFSRRDIAEMLQRCASGSLRGVAAIDANSKVATYPSFEHLHVLAVDDNAINREVLKEALVRLGVRADFAENGKEALRRVETQHYDFIFMDGSMPEMDGFEACRRIRARESETNSSRSRIVALTAQVAGHSKETWFEVGADDYVSKPFNLERISDALSKVSTMGLEVHAPITSHDGQILDADTIDNLDQLSPDGRVRKRVWEQFGSSSKSALKELIETANGNPSSNEVSRQAHAFKSMALSAGAKACAAQLSEIERQSQLEDTSLDTINRKLSSLADHLKHTLDEMARHDASQ